MYRVTYFSIDYAGTEYSDYWLGVGVCNTKWDDVLVGVGSDGAEAYDDARCHVAECYDGASIIPDKCPADIALERVPMAADRERDEWPNVYVAIYVRTK